MNIAILVDGLGGDADASLLLSMYIMLLGAVLSLSLSLSLMTSLQISSIGMIFTRGYLIKLTGAATDLFKVAEPVYPHHSLKVVRLICKVIVYIAERHMQISIIIILVKP